MAALQARNDIILNQGGDIYFLLLGQMAVLGAVESFEAGLEDFKALVAVADNILGSGDVIRNVLVLQGGNLIEIGFVILDVGDLPMTILCLFHSQLQGEGGLGVFLHDFDVSCGTMTIVFDLAHLDQRGIAHLTALQKAFKVDTQLAAFQDVRTFRQIPTAGGYPVEGGRFETLGQLWFNHDVEFFKHGAGLGGEFRIIGEQIHR